MDNVQNCGSYINIPSSKTCSPFIFCVHFTQPVEIYQGRYELIRFVLRPA
jgi:hypothetical protein